MGRKRKNEKKSEEEIQRKIKKLENQLAQARNRSLDSPSERNLPLEALETPYEGSIYCESPVQDTIQYDEALPYPSSSRLPSPHQLSPQLPSPHQLSPRLPSHPLSPHPVSFEALPQPAVSPQPQPGTSAEGNNTASTDEVELDEDTLLLLGDAPKAETPLGPPIHKDVAHRWQNILAKGLAKDAKENLLKEYLVPSNCDFLLPPALNPEVKAALPDALVKRDLVLVYKQKQLSVALSALSTVTNLVIANETSKQKILKPLSDACRILCDSHYSDTKTRRKFVTSSINVKLRDALVEADRDKFLFGENISEKLKAAKTIQQSGDALKNTAKTKFQRSGNNNNNNNNKGRLNFVPQHRKTDSRPSAADSRRAPANYTQRQPTTSNTRRPTDRSLPSRMPAPQRR